MWGFFSGNRLFSLTCAQAFSTQIISHSNEKTATMSEFQTVARVGDIPEGQGRSFPVNGTMVAIFLSEGNYYAINDFCPHMGASLADGHVEDHAVMCPWHAWRFSIRDGTWLDNSKSGIRSACYPVRLEGDDIQVAVPPKGQ